MLGKQEFQSLSEIHNISLEELKIVILDSGQRIGPSQRYEILSLLGTDIMGAVYLIRDLEQFGRLYTLKMLVPQLFQSAECQKQLLGCIQAIQETSSSHIVKIYHFYQKKPFYYYIMEYPQGLYLREWLSRREQKQEKISLPEALLIMEQACQALAHFQALSVPYLLNSQNILLQKSLKNTDKITVKLNGFSLENIPLSLSSRASRVMKTDIYMAPEKRQNPAYRDTRGDVFSLGIILYELLTLSPPKILPNKLLALHKIDPHLDQILAMALHRDPRQRYTNTTQMLADLSSLLQYDQGFTLQNKELPPEVDQEIQAPSKKSSTKKSSVDHILQEGDNLIDQECYAQAIAKWREALGTSSRDKEIRDRIMQVVDWVGEKAQEIQDENCFAAQNLLKEVIEHTEDPWIQEMWKQVGEQIEERENHLKVYLEEVEKHLEKKQFEAAIRVCQSALGLVPQKDSLLEKKIKQTSDFFHKVQGDEEELQKLIFTARTLEQREDYSGALKALERIRQKKDGWLCPVNDPGPDLERLSKLVASEKRSQKAQEILQEIDSLIKAKNWEKCTQRLSEPILKAQLLPSTQENLKIIREKVKAGHKKSKKSWFKFFTLIVFLAT